MIVLNFKLNSAILLENIEVKLHTGLQSAAIVLLMEK